MDLVSRKQNALRVLYQLHWCLLDSKAHTTMASGHGGIVMGGSLMPVLAASEARTQQSHRTKPWLLTSVFLLIIPANSLRSDLSLPAG